MAPKTNQKPWYKYESMYSQQYVTGTTDKGGYTAHDDISRRFRGIAVLIPRAALIIFDKFVPLQDAEYSVFVLAQKGPHGDTGLGGESTVRE